MSNKMSKMGILKNILKSVLQIFKKYCLKIDVEVHLKMSKIEHRSYGYISRNLRSKNISYDLIEHAHFGSNPFSCVRAH